MLPAGPGGGGPPGAGAPGSGPRPPLEAGETAGRVRFYVGEALVGESALVWAGGAQDDRTGGRRWYDWLEEFWLGLA